MQNTHIHSRLFSIILFPLHCILTWNLLKMRSRVHPVLLLFVVLLVALVWWTPLHQLQLLLHFTLLAASCVADAGLNLLHFQLLLLNKFESLAHLLVVEQVYDAGEDASNKRRKEVYKQGVELYIILECIIELIIRWGKLPRVTNKFRTRHRLTAIRIRNEAWSQRIHGGLLRRWWLIKRR